ncbi:cupin domain-containing protein [Erythrobacter sp.]|uniref:cupin domain-containing protein n=1 Tax=Erythrobacter sp. TaxID=1042 RepID=UPI001425C104|nr:cupin domain-containing protein [Erythrobacter sp.]QIQ87850.1 MAG: cupin domain-containing protein [Erythrobacter sp.]
MPKLDLEAIEQTNATGYPAPYDAQVAGRRYRRLTGIAGLTHMGASHVVLEPGAWSSQRHWHSDVDELLVAVSGEAVLVDDGGETPVRAGDVLAWPAGEANGHHLQNRSGEPFVYVAVSAGDAARDRGVYPDIDMTFGPEGYFRKDGSRYDTERLL